MLLKTNSPLCVFISPAMGPRVNYISPPRDAHEPMSPPTWAKDDLVSVVPTKLAKTRRIEDMEKEMAQVFHCLVVIMLFMNDIV